MYHYLFLVLSFVSLANPHHHYRLLSQFLLHEHANTLIWFHCNQSESMDLFRRLGEAFPGTLHAFEVDSIKFYHEHRRHMATKHYRLAVGADFNCPGEERFLEFCSQNSYFNASYHWLLFVEDELGRCFEVMKTQNLNVDSRVTIASGRSDASYEIYEMFGTIRRRKGRTHVVKVGTWSDSEDMNWTCSMSSFRSRMNLGGITLWSTVTSSEVPKHITLETYMQTLDPPREYVANRFGYRMMMLLGQYLNFKFKHIITNEWGFDIVGTNSTKGIIGQLQHNLVDVSTNLMAPTTERTGSFDQTIEIVTRRIRTLFRHPKNGGTRNIFLRPFENLLWFGISALVILSVGSLMLISFVEHQPDSINKFQHVLMIFGFLCQQGYSNKAVLSSLRIVIITILLFAIIVYQFYACFIIGYLLVLPPKNIRTVEQLLNSELKLSIEDVAYNRDYFNRTKNAVSLQLYERKILPNEFGFANISAGVALVKPGGYAFHCDTSYGYTWIKETFTDHEICELQEIQLYPIRPLHLVVPKGSPLKEPFRVSMRLMLDVGVVQYYRRKLFLKTPPCQTDSFSSVQVGFGDIADLYWMLAIGVAASLTIMAVEVMYYRMRAYLDSRRLGKIQGGWMD